MTMKTIILTIAFFLATVFPAFPQQTEEQQPGNSEEKQEEQKPYFYQWTDSKGVVHITDGLGKVPEKYRSRAKKLEAVPGEDIGNRGSQRENVRPFDYRAEEEREQELKQEWQLRMKEAKQRLADAEQRYRELKKRKDELLEKWGGVAALESGHFEGREEAQRLDQEMKQVQQEIDSARNEVEVEIPDEARKASIPPGWLRE